MWPNMEWCSSGCERSNRVAAALMSPAGATLRCSPPTTRAMARMTVFLQPGASLRAYPTNYWWQDRVALVASSSLFPHHPGCTRWSGTRVRRFPGLRCDRTEEHERDAYAVRPVWLSITAPTVSLSVPYIGAPTNTWEPSYLPPVATAAQTYYYPPTILCQRFQ